jgi:hypothetical protein
MTFGNLAVHESRTTNYGAGNSSFGIRRLD